MKPDQTFDVAVIGGGLSGQLAALAVANSGQANGKTVALFAPKAEQSDGRSTALFAPALDFLDEMGVLAFLQGKGEALKTMRILDGSRRILRTPPTDFVAAEAGLEHFGINFLNTDLLEAIGRASENLDNFSVVEHTVGDVSFHEEKATLLCNGDIAVHAKLVIAADGRNSIARAAASIDTKSWEYPQIALVANFEHGRPHNFVSTEFHTSDGPFTTVPMPGNKSSLVWVVSPEEAREILALTTAEASLRAEQIMQSMLGEVSFSSALQAFPLKGMIANKFAAPRLMLIGEAAHVFPPIGAQGFNLGVRDVQSVLKVLAADDASTDLGAEALCAAFDADRRLDVATRTSAVDALNRSLLTDFLPVQFARGMSLHALNSSSRLRKIAMKAGLGGKVVPKSINPIEVMRSFSRK